MFGLIRRIIRRHLNRVLEQSSEGGYWSLTPWEAAVWRNQVQARDPFPTPFPVFSTTWTVNTGWKAYLGYRTVCWIRRPEEAVNVARELRSEGWKEVFICSTRLGLTGPSHRVVENLEDPIEFSQLALELEREHLLFHVPPAIVRGIIQAVRQVIRFARSRENPSWYNFWAIVAWWIVGKIEPTSRELAPIADPRQWPISIWWMV
jgi:hypothetical protein